MELKKIDSEEFEKFALNHPLITFHQKESWGKLKKNNGWNYDLIGMYDQEKLIAATLLLNKKMPLGLKMFYAPRGYLIDFNNKNILKEFTYKLRDFVKKQNGIFIKIDPYISYIERDIDGNPVKDGLNNQEIVNFLKEIGYTHHGFNTDTSKELQPRWMFVLDTKDKSEEDLMKGMIKQTRKNVKKTLKMGLELERIGIEGLDEYKKITEHTGSRRGFIDRPLSYYQNMFKELKDSIKIILCYLNTEKSISLLQKEIDEINSYSEITESRKKELDELSKKIEDIKNIEKKHGKKVCLAGSMFIECGDELLNLYGGGYDEFMWLNAMYAIQWHAIKYAVENGFSIYNFYGIEGNFKKENNPMYGVYEFKKGFGGKVVELIGEFDFIVNKPKYLLYKICFSSYKKLKNLLNKIKK